MHDQQVTSKCFQLIRILNLITSAVIFGFGMFGLIFMALGSLLSGKIFLIFSPVFMMGFGVMLFAAECKVKFIIKRFGFLSSMIGRGIFNVYLSSQVFFYFACENNNGVLGWALGLCLFCLGILYISLHFCGGKEYTKKMKQSRAE